jgi:hypothetical protein
MSNIKMQVDQNDNRLLLIMLMISTAFFILTIGFRSTNPSVDALLKQQAIVQNVHLETTSNQYVDIAILFNLGHSNFSNEKILLDKKRIVRNFSYFESTLSLLKHLNFSRFIQLFYLVNQHIIFKLSVVLTI